MLLFDDRGIFYAIRFLYEKDEVLQVLKILVYLDTMFYRSCLKFGTTVAEKNAVENLHVTKIRCPTDNRQLIEYVNNLSGICYRLSSSERETAHVG